MRSRSLSNENIKVKNNSTTKGDYEFRVRKEKSLNHKNIVVSPIQEKEKIEFDSKRWFITSDFSNAQGYYHYVIINFHINVYFWDSIYKFINTTTFIFNDIIE